MPSGVLRVFLFLPSLPIPFFFPFPFDQSFITLFLRKPFLLSVLSSQVCVDGLADDVLGTLEIGVTALVRERQHTLPSRAANLPDATWLMSGNRVMFGDSLSTEFERGDLNDLKVRYCKTWYLFILSQALCQPLEILGWEFKLILLVSTETEQQDRGKGGTDQSKRTL